MRNNKTFSNLKLSELLEKEKISARCGLMVVDLKSGDCVHTLNIEGIVEELYDVMPLPNVIRPMAVGLKADEIKHMISIEE